MNNFQGGLKKMRKGVLCVLLLTLLSATVFGAMSTKLSLQGSARLSNGNIVTSGDLRVVVDDVSSCSDNSPLLNQTFVSGIVNGRFDELLTVSLDYNSDYYLCMFINGEQVGGPYAFRGGQGEINTEDIANNAINGAKVNSSSSLSIASLTTTGNVGVGTSALFNNNNILVLGANDSRIGTDTVDGADFKRLQLSGAASSTTRGAYINLYGNEYPGNFGNVGIVGGNAGGNITFYPGGSQSVVMTSDGNVGIGTTSPQANLHVVATSGNALLRIETKGSAYTPMLQLYSRGSIGGGRNWTIYSGDNSNLAGSLVFWDENAAERMVINSVGNVGIGTSSPSSKLQVNDSQNSTVQIQIQNNDETNTGALSRIVLLGGSSGTDLEAMNSQYNSAGTPRFARGGALTSSGVGGLSIATTIAPIRFYTAGDGSFLATNERMRIDTAGNVGIGTSSPQALLDVVGDVPVLEVRSKTLTNANASIVLSGDYFANQKVKNAIVAEGLSSWSRNNLHFVSNIVGDNSNYTLGADTRLFISGLTGNVGVGTTSPGHKLTVAGSGDSNTGVFAIDVNGNGTWKWASASIAPNLSVGNNLIHMIGQAESLKNSGYIGFNYQGAGNDSNFLTFGLYSVDNILNINGAGNVGIGTSTPSKTLEVKGMMKSTQFGEVLNYRSGDCGAGCNVYMNVSLNATWSGLTTDRGAGGVYFISFQSRIQGVGGLTGGATGILTLAKGYNQGWTVGFNEIASSGGVHITMNTVTNSVTSLKLNFVDNNFSPAEKFVSVVQLGPYDNYAGGVGPLTWQAHEY